MASEREFTKLIQEHQGLLMKVASVYTNTRTDREDLFQEIVYQLWKCFDSFRGESKITTWMYRVGMNTSITHLKKAKKQVSFALPHDGNLVEIQPEDSVCEEQQALLHRYIQNLNQLEKRLMLLLLEGKSYPEIADITGLSPSNVGTGISRIKKKIKDTITKN